MSDADAWGDVSVSSLGAQPDESEVMRAAAALLHPTLPHEITGLPSGKSRLVRLAVPEVILSAARDLGEGKGTFYTINPVRGDLGDHAAKVGDMTGRRNLLIDLDSKHPDDEMATDAERDRAWLLMDLVLAHLGSRGWPDPVVVDSGNGVQLLYLIDLPANDHSRILVRRALRALAGSVATEGASIDTSVNNANRLARLPGTWSRRGPSTPDRPHRMARLVMVPEQRRLVTLEMIEELVGRSEPDTPTVFKLWDAKVKDSPAREKAYVDAAIREELESILNAPGGTRNNALNAAAFAMGQLVGGGHLDDAGAREMLEDAARKVGLETDPNCGSAGIEKTIASGLESGKAQPRTIPPTKKAQKRARAAAVASAVKHDPAANGKPGEAVAAPPVILLASKVKPRRVEWLWPDRVPIGKLTTFAGWGGLGKSFVTMDLASRVSTGDEIPGQGGLCFEPASVLILNTEDDPAAGTRCGPGSRPTP